MWWRKAKAVFAGDDEPIDELPDLDLGDDESLKDLLSRRRWNLGNLSMQDRYDAPSFDMEIIPHLIEGIREEPYGHGSMFYDPSMVDIDREGYRPFMSLRKDSGVPTKIPWEREEGYLFRGMSDEELLNALESGYFESRGEHNLGEEQRGLTYFSPDPDKAAYYAGGFAPLNWLPSFKHPGFVAKIPRRRKSAEVPVPGIPDEIGLRGRIPLDDMELMKVQPYGITSGGLQLMPRWRNGKYIHTEGSRHNPGVYYGFKEQDPNKVAEELF